jgi:hypothetical protein
VYIVKEKGRKPDGKPHPLTYGLRNPYRNLKSENSQDYAQKPERNCTFVNSARLCAKQIFREASVKLCRKAMGEI